MTPREQEIRSKIVAHIRKTGRCPQFASVGTDWFEGEPIFRRMFDEGVLEEATRLSPKGRNVSYIKLGPNA